MSDLTEELSNLRNERDVLHRAVRQHAGESAAARHLGNAEYGPLLSQHLKVNVTDGGQVAIQVVDHRGRARTRLDPTTAKFLAFSIADLASEIMQKWPELAPNGLAPGAKATESTMRTARAQQEAQARAPLSDIERQTARSKNPWQKGSFNLTEQMRLERRDPALARELMEAA